MVNVLNAVLRRTVYRPARLTAWQLNNAARTGERSFRLFLSVRLRAIATDNEIVVELRNKLTSDELCDNTADDELFKAVRLLNHLLHALLPPPSAASQRYNLRHRAHSLQLPQHSTQLSDFNFLTCMLYKNT